MYDLIIIGAGPAGLTAALYAGRYRLNTLIIEKVCAGGQILLSSTIENYPGFPGGISTEELICRFKKQVDELAIKIEEAEVIQVDTGSKLIPPVYTVSTKDKALQAKTIIIAVGAHWKHLGVEGEERLIGKGVSYCATCDGPLFKNKEVTVVGGGDKAIEEAIFLSGYAGKINLIHRRQGFRAAEILLEKAKSNPRINFILDSTVEEIQGLNRVEAVKIKNVLTGALSEIACQGVFIFIGIEPNTRFLKNQLATDEMGFIITDEQMRTSEDGIFACGDCRGKSLYQVINACGEAAVAAHSVHTYLLNQNE